VVDKVYFFLTQQENRTSVGSRTQSTHRQTHTNSNLDSKRNNQPSITWPESQTEEWTWPTERKILVN